MMFTLKEPRPFRLGGAPLTKRFQLEDKNILAATSGVIQKDWPVNWWQRMGQLAYPQAKELLITADAGGSNSYRARLWKYQLQKLSDETGLGITVCHFPPGTSKWNKIEHRMFCHITANWRARPLESLEVIVNLIASTQTRKGLTIQAALNVNSYSKGIKVSDEEMSHLNITPADFHGEWNYSILPRMSGAPKI